ncbi:Asp-tRNA(Asn)/Glu-tRNA(Gln) amidotransferase subunit GatA [Lacicoccus alkaliphilus]|uniref:Glutamyl-tRNA(Gln) amidotransferase subunit A n=1 Tax=Lacicoccus alkaliphilus DSM 16010 TaxID=1123231 RepID=A0A1M7JBE0_9BACL|nr:Asp-tRNA(Asn)/Glu-tRNA(Gln) amidotransferase subunit GatA [Salinicoccus alkaliphilus]SHM49807.1 aspartyl/glutamyl-tRNA(Asn/Gln) amidotransferase subunit A [Salinicoccus alkaliphilus DSM 16010]
MNIYELTVEELYDKIQQKELKPSEVVGALFEDIDKIDETLGSFLFVNKEDAMKEAARLDDLQAQDQMDGELFGIPMGIKDNIITKGVLTTCASRMLEDFHPIYDATVMEKLNAESPVLMGKNNMDEFAMGGSNENSYFKNVRNPWDTDAVPGGSSGGSAAAVAAGLVPFSLGSDTGGSVRQPASFCGVVGMKPTYGRVSRYGLVAFASSLDQIGPLTRNVRDNAKILNLISGTHNKDATSMPDVEEDFLKSIDADLTGKKIALPDEYVEEGIDEEVAEAVKNAVKVFEDLGATVERVSFSDIKYVVSAYYLIASSEASSNLARFDGIRFGHRAEGAETLEELYKKTRAEGFGEEVKRRILLGTFVLSAGHYDQYYIRAQKLRSVIEADMERILEDYDMIIGPTTTTPAYDLGEKIDDKLQMYKDDILTIPANLTGMPAISIPCGVSSKNRPIGMQITGRHFAEAEIYNAAYKFEEQFNLHNELKEIQKELR